MLDDLDGCSGLPSLQILESELLNSGELDGKLTCSTPPEPSTRRRWKCAKFCPAAPPDPPAK